MTRESHKEEDPLIDVASLWGKRVFDLLIISGIVTVVFSRVTYLLAHPDLLMATRWFWLPYERIEGTIFLFDSLPWLLLKVWTGEILLDGIVLGWLVSLAAVSRLMKVKWGSISNALADFFWVWFIAVELYAAVIWKIPWLLLAVAVFLVLGGIRYWTNRIRDKEGSSRSHRSVSIIWKVSTIVGVPVALLVNNVYFQEIPYQGFAVSLNIVAGIAGIWIISGDVLEFFSILASGKKSEDREVITDGTSGAAEVGRAYSGSEDGWRSFAESRSRGGIPRPGEARSVAVRDPETKRSHSRSYKAYKDLPTRISGAISVMIHRLTKRRSGYGTDSRGEEGT